MSDKPDGYLVLAVPLKLGKPCSCAKPPKVSSKANSEAYVTEYQRIFGGKAKEASA